jgi:transcriptional regulator of arginine metabolism
MTKYSQPKNNDNAKTKRQKALLSLIRQESLGTQGELVERLCKAGFPCTQVSISRDIRDLGLVKKGGRYAAPDSGASSESVFDLSSNIAVFIKSVTPVGDNLVVIKTLSGTAHSVGLLMDNLNWSKIAGTVAGDDTVFIAVLGGAKGCAEVATKLTQLIHKGR